MMGMTKFNIQLWLTHGITKDRELILSELVWKEGINSAKHAVAKILRENTDSRLGTLDAYPGSTPPQNIKWEPWGEMTQHASPSGETSYNRIERKSKPITARIAPIQKYVEAVITWYPRGNQKS